MNDPGGDTLEERAMLYGMVIAERLIRKHGRDGRIELSLRDLAHHLGATYFVAVEHERKGEVPP